MIRIRTLFALLLCIYLIGFGAHAAMLGKTVYGDGIFYYSWVRSTVVDNDIDFTNDYTEFGVTQPITPSGLPGNKYSIGASILWYPWFAWTHTLVRGSGYEPIYQYVTGLSSVLYALVGLILLYRTLRRQFSEPIAIITILATALCTHLLFYGSIDAVNSHAASFFATSLFVTLLMQRERRWFQIGCAIGLVALVRTQDIVVGLAILPFIKPKHIAAVVAGGLYVFMPQLLVWQILNNAFWKSPYISSIEGFNFLSPHIAGVLFSTGNGLFLWTPVLLLGIAGLWMYRQTKPNIYFLLAIAIQIFVVSSWSIWWQGASYSGRMFVGTIPLFAFGMAGMFKLLAIKHIEYKDQLLSVIIPLAFINMLLILYFLISH